MTDKSPTNLQSFPEQNQIRKPWGEAERAVRRRRILKSLKGMTGEKLVYRTQSSLERGRKWLRVRLTAHTAIEKSPVFIFGSNRSGTQMVCEAVGRSPHSWDYRESEFSPAFNSYYLRADWLIKWLIRLSPAPIVCFGSILDSQSADDILERFNGAMALWVYRRFEDAANSSVRNWDHMNDLIRLVAQGEPERLGARGNRISADTIRLFSELFHDDLSSESGACLYWYMRNQIFFDLDLDKDPRVLLVQYEDTVLNKERSFRRISDFLGIPYDPAIISDVFASSVGKHSWPGVEQRVQEVCEDLKTRLDARYAETSDWIPFEQERTNDSHRRLYYQPLRSFR